MSNKVSITVFQNCEYPMVSFWVHGHPTASQGTVWESQAFPSCCYRHHRRFKTLLPINTFESRLAFFQFNNNQILLSEHNFPIMVILHFSFLITILLLCYSSKTQLWVCPVGLENTCHLLLSYLHNHFLIPLENNKIYIYIDNSLNS